MADKSNKQPKKRRKWSADDMAAAYDSVTKGSMSVYKAAQVYNVPRITLHDRLTGRVKLDTQMGRPTALGSDDEAALVRYAKYLAEHRYPVTRSGIIGLAWAMSLQKEQKVFSESGPSLRWWRGFRNRHKDELKLRKPEAVSHGRVDNAKPDIINGYFDLLQNVLEQNDLQNKPHLIFNCDEAAIFLNKSSQKVLIPAKSKHAHMLSSGTNQHISVLCSASAAGSTIPPLIIFSKGLPFVRNYQSQGPINATYATSNSGFVDREMYLGWFEKNFLCHAPKERPLLLLEDSAAAHMSPQLIEMAISENVILMCFPPNLTHILQPLDVAVFRTMKAELSKVMHQVKLLRSDFWVTKQQFPSVFKPVFEKTFTPHLITNAFRKCGIYPLDRNAVCKEMISVPIVSKGTTSTVTINDTQIDSESVPEQERGNEPQTTASNLSSPQPSLEEPLLPEMLNTDSLCKDISISSDYGNQVLVDMCVETTDHIPAGSEVLLDDTNVCPPQLAVEAIESTLTPKKRKLFDERYNNDVTNERDDVYTTWKYLKKKSSGESALLNSPSNEKENPFSDNPLVKAGIVPQAFADILTPVPEKKKQTIRMGKKKLLKAQVLTSEEISSEILKAENTKKQLQEAKEERKLERELKKRAKEEKKLNRSKIKKGKNEEKNITRPLKAAQKKESSVKKDLKAKRRTIEAAIITKENNNARKTSSPQFINTGTDESQDYIKTLQEALIDDSSVLIPDVYKYLDIDHVSANILAAKNMCKGFEPQRIIGDGNCLPRTASFLASGHQERYREMRMRIAMELAIHKDLYLSDTFLSRGLDRETNGLSVTYAMFSGQYTPGSRLSDVEIKEVYENELKQTMNNGVYMGIWEIHAVASILGAPIQSVYPAAGPAGKTLNRLVLPRDGCQRYDEQLYIMWTTTNKNINPHLWYQPNHFVPLVKPGLRMIPIMSLATELKEARDKTTNGDSEEITRTKKYKNQENPNAKVLLFADEKEESQENEQMQKDASVRAQESVQVNSEHVASVITPCNSVQKETNEQQVEASNRTANKQNIKDKENIDVSTGISESSLQTVERPKSIEKDAMPTVDRWLGRAQMRKWTREL